MAIPLSANQDHIEEQYQRLERILYELYLVLRALMEPQAQPLPHATNQQPPRGGSGGGSRRNRRRNNSSSSSHGRRRCSSNGSSSQNGPQNPPPSPPPSCGDTASTCTASTTSTTTLLLNLANLSMNQKTAAVAGGSCAVDSVQWGKLGVDLRTLADSLNSGKCQNNLAPNSPTNKSSSSTLKLATLAMSLLMSRNWSSD